MSFIEFAVVLGLFAYSLRHNLWLDAPWINKVDHRHICHISHITDVKPTEKQNKVFSNWVKTVIHDGSRMC